jgi:hypothetical protein
VRLHILTAVTRLENLDTVGASIDAAKARARNTEVEWHRRLDPDRRHVGGQKLKNDMLDAIRDGWVCVLDDDTVMHEQFIQKIEIVEATQELASRQLDAIVVSQKRTSGAVLRARPEHVVVGKIDAGQAVLRRKFIGDRRIPETYAGDGIWLESLLRGGADVHYMRDVLSLHNAISGVDPGPPQEVQA